MKKTLNVNITQKNPSDKCLEGILQHMEAFADEFTEIYGTEVEIEIEYQKV